MLVSAGCSGASRTSLLSAPVTSVAASHRATVSIHIPARVPQEQARKPAYVSPSTQGIAITVYPATATPPPLPTTVASLAPGSPACAGNADGSSTCTVTVQAPIGNDDFIVTTYDQPPAGVTPQGNVLSTDAISFTVVYGQTNTVVGLVLNGVPASIVLSPPNFLVPAGLTRTFTFNVDALDADGNYIIGPGNYTNPIALTIAGDPNGTLSLSTNTIDGPATTTVTGTYNGGTLPGTATITATATGASNSGAVVMVRNGGGGLPPGSFTEFPLAASSQPFSIVTGADGNLWFVETISNKIGRMTPAGTLTEFSIPTAASNPFGAADGADGNVWFTEAGKIGRITPGGVITEFTVSGNYSGGRITAGPDGNLWFADFANDKIGTITTSGAITEYPIPNGSGNPAGVTAGPDGAVWFTEEFADQIGRITTNGVITEFPLGVSGSFVNSITTGPDGNLWFTEPGLNNVGRITPTGTVTEFPVPPAGSVTPNAIAAGPDGNLWFTDEVGVGQITPAGAITLFPVATSALTNSITTGPDGNLWFTESVGNKIGRMVP